MKPTHSLNASDAELEEVLACQGLTSKPTTLANQSLLSRSLFGMVLFIGCVIWCIGISLYWLLFCSWRPAPNEPEA